MGAFHPPFSIADFLDVFARYNTAIWPLHIVAYLLGVLVLAAALRPFRGSDRLVSGVLAALWIWVGAVYHLRFFREINGAALVFGIVFILQGLLFLALGVIGQQLRFQAKANAYGIVGGFFALFAMVIYPALGYVFGHIYPHAPMFGVAPCPLVIFTFGLFLFTTRRMPGYLLIIPTLWSILGLSAATALGVRQDLALILSAVVSISMLIARNRRKTEDTVTLSPSDSAAIL